MYIYAIALEDSAYIGKYSDVFSDLFKQLNIEDTEENRKTKFVRCWLEIVDCDIFDSINQISAATIEVKQDETPPWFNEDDALEQTKEAFKKWHDEHILIDQEIDTLSSGFYYLKNCKVGCLSGDVKIEECEDCQIDIMLDKASIWWCNDTQIGEMFDESSVFYTDKSAIVKYAYENAQIHKSIKLEYDYRNNEES